MGFVILIYLVLPKEAVGASDGAPLTTGLGFVDALHRCPRHGRPITADHSTREPYQQPYPRHSMYGLFAVIVAVMSVYIAVQRVLGHEPCIE